MIVCVNTFHSDEILIEQADPEFIDSSKLPDRLKRLIDEPILSGEKNYKGYPDLHIDLKTEGVDSEDWFTALEAARVDLPCLVEKKITAWIDC